jgi:hypothetical protein
MESVLTERSEMPNFALGAEELAYAAKESKNVPAETVIAKNKNKKYIMQSNLLNSFTHLPRFGSLPLLPLPYAQGLWCSKVKPLNQNNSIYIGLIWEHLKKIYRTTVSKR